jgi:hypothetical protein
MNAMSQLAQMRTPYAMAAMSVIDGIASDSIGARRDVRCQDTIPSKQREMYVAFGDSHRGTIVHHVVGVRDIATAGLPTKPKCRRLDPNLDTSVASASQAFFAVREKAALGRKGH